MIVVIAARQAIRERGELPREQLGALAIDRGERPGPRSTLQVDHADRRLHANRRAQHGLDQVLPDTAKLREPGIERCRGRLDRAALADRPRDDAARDRRPDRRDVAVRAPEPLPEPRTIGFIVVQLQICRAGAGDLHDERERLIEHRLALLLAAEVQEPTIEVSLACKTFLTRRAVSRHAARVSIDAKSKSTLGLTT